MHPLQWTGGNLQGDMLMRLRGTLRAATADATAVHTLPQIAVKADVTDTATIRALIDSLNLKRCPADAADLADVELSYATTDQQARPYGIHVYSPSCQPYSLANDRPGLLGGKRVGLLHHVAQSIINSEPLFAIIENVTQMLQHPAWKRCAAALKKAGYGVHPCILLLVEIVDEGHSCAREFHACVDGDHDPVLQRCALLSREPWNRRCEDDRHRWSSSCRLTSGIQLDLVATVGSSLRVVGGQTKRSATMHVSFDSPRGAQPAGRRRKLNAIFWIGLEPRMSRCRVRLRRVAAIAPVWAIIPCAPN